VSEDERLHPTSAAGFGGDMSVYERGRPSYPADAVAWLVDALAISPGTSVLDLAAGTGKFTRLLLPTGADVTAVDPSAAMRSQFTAAVPGVPIVDGTAESLPLPDASVDAVTVAQAFHWFDVAAATTELARVIRPGGGFGMIWNERDASVPWVRELNAIFGWERREEYGVPRNIERDWHSEFAAHAHPRFARLAQFETTYSHVLDVDTLVLRVLSTSYVASAPSADQSRVAAAVRTLVADFPETFELPYVTVAYHTV
jgi:SAM-dependent methyltransferase